MERKTDKLDRSGSQYQKRKAGKKERKDDGVKERIEEQKDGLKNRGQKVWVEGWMDGIEKNNKESCTYSRLRGHSLGSIYSFISGSILSGTAHFSADSSGKCLCPASSPYSFQIALSVAFTCRRTRKSPSSLSSITLTAVAKTPRRFPSVVP